MAARPGTAAPAGSRKTCKEHVDETAVVGSAAQRSAYALPTECPGAWTTERVDDKQALGAGSHLTGADACPGCWVCRCGDWSCRSVLPARCGEAGSQGVTRDREQSAGQCQCGRLCRRGSRIPPLQHVDSRGSSRRAHDRHREQSRPLLWSSSVQAQSHRAAEYMIGASGFESLLWHGTPRAQGEQGREDMSPTPRPPQPFATRRVAYRAPQSGPLSHSSLEVTRRTWEPFVFIVHTSGRPAMPSRASVIRLPSGE
jgi:hypothetical protein